MMRTVLLFLVLVSVGVWTNNLHAENPEEPKDIDIDHVDIETRRNKKMNLMEEMEQLQEANDNLRSDKMTRKNLQDLRPADCADLRKKGVKHNGVYDIYPYACSTCATPMRVFCDMKTDGGGWTVIMTRQQQSKQVNFNRSWTDYKNGFGKLKGEHWLGNDNIHTLTGSRTYALRLDIEDADGDKKKAIYTTFKMENEALRYRMMLSGASSYTTAYDCFTYNRYRYFTTYDRDFDSKSGMNCATEHGGGFWYYDCRTSPFTGVYDGVLNHTCGYYTTVYQASHVQMKIRPTVCSANSNRGNCNKS